MTSKVAKNGANLRRSSLTQKSGIHDEVEVEDVDEASEVIPLRYMISSYGADYPVDGIVKRLNAHNIIIPTFDPEFEASDSVDGFQRQFVWTKNQCDRFVESLLLGLPVPGIFPIAFFWQSGSGIIPELTRAVLAVAYAVTV